MRLRSIARNTVNALSDGAAWAARRADPAVRRLAQRFAGAPGSIELVSVLDGENGRITCRFRVRYRGNEEPELGVWRLGGRRAPFAVKRVSRIRRDGDMSEVVYSVFVPRRVVGFFIGGPAVGLLSVSSHDLIRLARQRDKLMINPGIDERYDHPLRAGQGLAPTDDPGASPVSTPLFSIIVPLYRTLPAYFRAMVDSVLAQTYGNWELVLVNASPDDAELARAIAEVASEDNPRIVIVELDENKGISENTVAGIEVASGDYLSFLDHDDLLAPDALEQYAHEIDEHPEADLLYCDEDSVTQDGTTCFEARFKPDLNYDLLLTHNYVCHFLTVSRVAYEQVEPYTREVDGAQDYDLTLKIYEVARSVRHVPRVLYHWRQHEGSTNGGATQAKPYVIASSINTLTRHLTRRGIDATVIPTDYPCVFEVIYPVAETADVSVVVVYRSDEELAACLESLESQRLASVCQLIEAGPAVDLASAVNEAAASATGAYLLVVDARVRFVPENDCVGVLRDAFCRSDVGIASAKVMAEDGHVLHAGLCVKEDGTLGYLNQGFIGHMGGGYHGLAECDCAYSAVAPLCFMVRADDIRAVGGMSCAYEDAVAQMADFSFKMRALGKSVVVRPSAVAYALMDPEECELGRSVVLAGSHDHELLWHSHDAGYARDVLENPNVSLSESYPTLK